VQTSSGIELNYKRLDPSNVKSSNTGPKKVTLSGEHTLILSLAAENKTMRAIQRKVNDLYNTKLKLTEIENIIKYGP
jgi:hypothetical protein